MENLWFRQCKEYEECVEGKCEPKGACKHLVEVCSESVKGVGEEAGGPFNGCVVSDQNSYSYEEDGKICFECTICPLAWQNGKWVEFCGAWITDIYNSCW